MMATFPEGKAIVYCQGAFNTTNGKTAHGLVRRTHRYKLLSIVDSVYAGQDAGDVLDGVRKEIPIYGNIHHAVEMAKASGHCPSHLVIGLAPDGGRLSQADRQEIKRALEFGLNIDSGLHDFLSDDPEFADRAAARGLMIRDIRKMPSRNDSHFFCGKIEEVTSLKIALLGTDSAVGKRTTAWLLVDELQKAGFKAQLIGTGQTAWLQGAEYTIILDSLINDFVAGEIEHTIWRAWNEERPDVMVIEGQGSLMNPAYPGGFEILAAGRPDIVVLQHAPGRKEYDGFPGYVIHPLTKQIQAIELLSEKPVIAVTVNHENIAREDISTVCKQISRDTGLPSCDPLTNGVWIVVKAALQYLKSNMRKGAS